MKRLVAKFNLIATKADIPMIDSPREFEVRESCLIARFFGPFDSLNNIAHFRAAMAECQRLGMNRLLCDVTQEVGALSFLSRFHLGDEVATFWDSRIRLVVLAREDQVDKDRFAVMVARNRGIDVQIFCDQDEALVWLLS